MLISTSSKISWYSFVLRLCRTPTWTRNPSGTCVPAKHVDESPCKNLPGICRLGKGTRLVQRWSAQVPSEEARPLTGPKNILEVTDKAYNSRNAIPQFLRYYAGFPQLPRYHSEGHSGCAWPAYMILLKWWNSGWINLRSFGYIFEIWDIWSQSFSTKWFWVFPEPVNQKIKKCW